MLTSLDALLAQGRQARRDNRLADARAHYAQAAEVCREAKNAALLAQALTGLGQIERDLNNHDSALKLYSEASALYRKLDSPLALAHTIRHVADILRNQKKLKEAEPCYSEALAIYRSHIETPPLDLANAIRGYALLKDSMGDADEAMHLWSEAKNLYEEAGVQAGVAESESHIAFHMGR
jgi:tetratricopeptide (TPR) repeat protein